MAASQQTPNTSSAREVVITVFGKVITAAQMADYTFDPKHMDPDVSDATIEAMDFSDLARAAYFNDRVREHFDRVYGFRGLPLLPKVKLFPHQLEAIKYAVGIEKAEPSPLIHAGKRTTRGGILKMETGLGKSLTAVALAMLRPRTVYADESPGTGVDDSGVGSKGYPTLIVCSKTVMNEFKTQCMEKFFYGDRALYLHKDFFPGYANLTVQQTLEYDVVFTTYDVLVSICRKREYHSHIVVYEDQPTGKGGRPRKFVVDRQRSQTGSTTVTGYEVLYQIPWQRVIADESQRFVNSSTYTYEAMMALYGEYKWCLSATPIRNYKTDIWSQFRFCGYNRCIDKKEWKRMCMVYMKSHGLTKFVFELDYQKAGIVLPKPIIKEEFIVLDGENEEMYAAIHQQAKKIYNMVAAGLVNFAAILAVICRLRQCCISPYLMTRASKRDIRTNPSNPTGKKRAGILVRDTAIEPGSSKEDDTPDTSEVQEIIATIVKKTGKTGIDSNKLQHVLRIIRAIPPGEKVLVFSSFTSCLDLVTDMLREYLPDFTSIQVDGGVTGKERNDLINAFRTQPEIRGMFMTYKVGGEGLNLIEAEHVIYMEPWWSPSTMKQAGDRAYRNGQTKHVTMYHLYAANTIERRIMEICKEKTTMAKGMLEGTRNIKIDMKTIKRLLQRDPVPGQQYSRATGMFGV